MTIDAPPPRAAAAGQCSGCMYFAADPLVAGQGWCQRYPPTALYFQIARTHAERFQSRWPQVSADDGCGEFRKMIPAETTPSPKQG